MLRLALCIALLLSALPLEAYQSRDVEALQTRLGQLERQLRAVQRRVFNGPALEAPAGGDAAPATGGGNQVAELQIKLAALERQLSQLTGRLEELEFAQRQNANAVKAVQRELELRFASGAPTTVPGSSTPPAPRSAAPGAPEGQPLGDQLPAPQAPAVPSVALPDGTPRERFDYAFGFIRSNNLDDGRKAMELFLEAHSDDLEIATNARFWLGRIHLRQDRPAEAAQAFLTIIETAPNHPKFPDALIDLSEAAIGLGSNADACDALLEFRKVADGTSPRLKSRAARLSERAGCGT